RSPSRQNISTARRRRTCGWKPTLSFGRAPACRISPATALAVSMTPLKPAVRDRKSTRLNSSHVKISYAVFCLKKKKQKQENKKQTDKKEEQRQTDGSPHPKPMQNRRCSSSTSGYRQTMQDIATTG